MQRMSFGLAAVALCLAVPAENARGQAPRDRLQEILNAQDAKIGEQRVQRQTEVMRLERLIEPMQDRIVRLERQLLSTSWLPAITIPEAEAELAFAEAQLAESERLFDNGAVTEVQVARDRLALVRARGQLESAKAAHAEARILMELNVAYAQRDLLAAANEKEQMQRMVAKGYSSSEALRYQIIEVDLAEKQLKLARLRLDSLGSADPQADAAADTEAPPVVSPAAP
jgi:hypothetical protein